MNTEQKPPAARVLVVDDEPDIANLVALRLRQGGYTAEAMTDGEAALEWCETQTPDAVVLDVRMPGIDGYELARRLRDREATRNVPILFLSASVREEDVDLGYAAGGDAYLRKPFSASDLREEIEWLLEHGHTGAPPKVHQ